MRKTILFLLFLLTFISSSSAQNLHLPDWIKGTWCNMFESNFNNIEYWTFFNDSITILSMKTFSYNNIIESYKDYKIKTYSNKYVYRIAFIKKHEKIIYEFKRHEGTVYDVPFFLTISLSINEKKIRKHCPNSNNIVYIKDTKF